MNVTRRSSSSKRSKRVQIAGRAPSNFLSPMLSEWLTELRAETRTGGDRTRASRCARARSRGGRTAIASTTKPERDLGNELVELDDTMLIRAGSDRPIIWPAGDLAEELHVASPISFIRATEAEVIVVALTAQRDKALSEERDARGYLMAPGSAVEAMEIAKATVAVPMSGDDRWDLRSRARRSGRPARAIK